MPVVKTDITKLFSWSFLHLRRICKRMEVKDFNEKENKRTDAKWNWETDIIDFENRDANPNDNCSHYKPRCHTTNDNPDKLLKFPMKCEPSYQAAEEYIYYADGLRQSDRQPKWFAEVHLVIPWIQLKYWTYLFCFESGSDKSHHRYNNTDYQ